MGSVEKYDQIERAAELFLKKYKYTEIARELGVTPAYAKALVEDYQALIKRRAEDDPDLLDRLVENTIETLDTLALIEKEIWETYQKAKDFEMINQQNATLKNAMDITEKRAKLLQLMGAKADSGNTARLQKAEKVNQIVSEVMRDIVSQCPRCKIEAQIKLAEAFRLMENAENIVEMHELETVEIDMSEEEHEIILGDILRDD